MLTTVDEDDDKIKLTIKLKPSISIYDDLEIKLNDITESLNNKMHYYFVTSYYGRILCTETFHLRSLNFKDTDNQSNIENILNTGLHNEIFLTPQIAIIIDELSQKGK
ncbi:unnamed protein product [Rotaria sp. Silwood2]|nr:unnamed protein product [Rotaria sp. Silwood2]